MDTFDLVDIQGAKYPNKNKFSYEATALKMKSRIAFFLIAKSLKLLVYNTDIQTSIAPDHKIVCLSLNWDKEFTRGPGFWEFNNTLYKDENCIDRIQKLYPDLLRKYSDIQQDEQLLWELLKMEIRSSTIFFTKGKSKLQRERELLVKEQLDELDRKICSSDDLQNIDQDLKRYEALKKELQSLYDDKGDAAKFRSKCRWLEEGERSTKYFFNLEKRNYNRKVISELENENGEVISNEEQILLEIEHYYSNLYSSKINLSEETLRQFTEDLELPQLSNEESEKLDGPLTFEECRTILASFEKDKSPGEDGYTVEFYLAFFDLVGENLVRSLNAGHEKGRLSISQRRGAITLIPKEDTSLNLLQN